jgi:hypothetical protein
MSRPELEAKLKEIRDHNIVNGESIGVEVIEVTEDNNVETSLSKKHTKK